MARSKGSGGKGKSSGGGKGKNHRSAKTGRFVKESTAKRNPDTTVSEKRK